MSARPWLPSHLVPLYRPARQPAGLCSSGRWDNSFFDSFDVEITCPTKINHQGYPGPRPSNFLLSRPTRQIAVRTRISSLLSCPLFDTYSISDFPSNMATNQNGAQGSTASGPMTDLPHSEVRYFTRSVDTPSVFMRSIETDSGQLQPPWHSRGDAQGRGAHKDIPRRNLQQQAPVQGQDRARCRLRYLYS